MNDIAAAWQNANLYASVVGGASATIDNAFVTLSDFLGAGNSLLSDAKNLALTTPYVRLIGWSGNNRTLRIQVQSGTGVTFTTPGSGQSVQGILVHEETDVDPGSSFVWSFEPSVGSTQGGDVVWGNSGENIPLTYNPVSGGTSETGRSSLEAIRAVADYWGTTDARLGYSLVRDNGETTFSAAWETLQDALTAGVQFCSGTEPGKTVANSPKHLLADRVSPGTWSDPRLYYNLQTTTQVTFDSTDGQWAPGQNAVAVMTYLFLETPAWDPLTVRIWCWDNITTYTLQVARNLIYGGVSGSGNKNTLQVAVS